MGFCRKFPGGGSISISHCKFPGWGKSFSQSQSQSHVTTNGSQSQYVLLVLNRSLSNAGYIVMNVPQALASTVSTCSLYVIFSWKTTPRYFTLIPTVKEEISRFSSHYNVGISVHPNELDTGPTTCLSDSSNLY
jgi:hypothetical protein